MARAPKTAGDIRKEASRICRAYADTCDRMGDNEAADALRDAAQEIGRIRLTKDLPA